MLLAGTAASKVGDAMIPALSIRNNVTGNAMEHLKSVEKSALCLGQGPPHGIMSAGTSATRTPSPVKANVQHQTQSFVAQDV